MDCIKKLKVDIFLPWVLRVKYDGGGIAIIVWSVTT